MTIYFEWTKDFSVGNEVIDAQHQKLLSQINKILEAVVFGVESRSVQEEMIDFLSTYIKEHLAYEEKYMKDIGYPDIEAHLEKHHNFITRYVEFKERFNKGEDKEKLITDVEQFVGNWWVEHIGTEDKKYYDFLKNKKNKDQIEII